MSSKQIIWKGIYYNTMEYLHFTTDAQHNIRGYITGLVNQLPLHIQYQLTIDLSWDVTAVDIKVHGLSENEFLFTKPDGRWHDKQGTIHGIFDECEFVDISVTPCTNTLPVNKLRLAVGEVAVIGVVYFDIEKLEVKPVKQRYTRITEREYRYESLATGFTAVLEVDEDGFVRDYPGIWKRV